MTMHQIQILIHVIMNLFHTGPFGRVDLPYFKHSTIVFFINPAIDYILVNHKMFDIAQYFQGTNDSLLAKNNIYIKSVLNNKSTTKPRVFT